ncbi:MAG: DUF4185 domain-containing protein [Bacteroidales bacterium]|nr:DUF4185 domain-containing protein [Bacteroidales bacterium]
MKLFTINVLLITSFCLNQTMFAQLNPDTLTYPGFVWKSEPPADCPFEPSEQLSGIKFPGIKSGFRVGDTWYPSWAEDDRMYSPFTDGHCPRLDGGNDLSISDGVVAFGYGAERTSTGQAVMEGDDPMTLKIYSLGLSHAPSLPYHGRYPAGSLVLNGVWYYGTYCLDPAGQTKYGEMVYNWPWLGPFVGFRYSTDYGRTWTETPHTPENPLFGETGLYGHPVKIGSPHFVDFGRNMEHSPDGKAYLVAHGADLNDAHPRFYNASWITGDQVYLFRVTPSVENINDIGKYEFYAGKDKKGNPLWTTNFNEIKPLLEWNNNMGCVTVTYNAPLKKYLMCVTDGGNTCAKMNSYILEADQLTGEWKLVSYMKNFGEQAYFLNIPSKFISDDGKTAWLLYSGNFAKDWNGEKIIENPPGSHYGMVFQKIEFLSRRK